MGNIIITAEQNGEKLEMRIDSDKYGEDFKYVFRSIMNFLTFQPKTIEEVIANDNGVVYDKEETASFKRKDNKN